VFFGFDYDDFWLRVVALNSWLDILLIIRFPLLSRHDVDFDFGPSAYIAQNLLAFVSHCEADPYCGLPPSSPPLLNALAKHLEAPAITVPALDTCNLALPGQAILAGQGPIADVFRRAFINAATIANSRGGAL
jgi:hypothetical protein